MAYFSFVSCLSIMVYIFCCATVEPAPHIIGGGWNSDLEIAGDNSAMNPSLFKSVLSSLTRSRSHDNQPSNVDSTIVSGLDDRESNSTVTENKSDMHPDTVAQISGMKLPPPPVSGLEQVNPLFRHKRQACQIPANLGLQINQLQSRLNNMQYVGLNPSESSHPEIPSNQPNSCPNSTNNWWPKAELNLRSNCPWKISEKDLGAKAYPRYITEATCLCQRCINASGMGCQNLRQDVTYFEHEGCLDGLALMVKKTINIVVGCYCVHSPPQNSQPVQTTDPPATDEY